MERIATTLLLLTCLLMMSSNANLVSRESKSFLDVFNIVRLNPNARLGIGVQITFPISTFMPDLGMFGRQSRSPFARYTQTSWPNSSPTSAFPTCPSQGVSVEDYLFMMRIDEAACQARFICEMSSDPPKFKPLSEIFLKKLSINNKWTAHSYDSDTSEYNLYQAAQFGVEMNKDCSKQYSMCPVAATSMINMEILWGWQVLSSIFNIMFVGETQANILNV